MKQSVGQSEDWSSARLFTGAGVKRRQQTTQIGAGRQTGKVPS